LKNRGAGFHGKTEFIAGKGKKERRGYRVGRERDFLSFSIID
jgi:hypothetical protein